jgi:hypothetical protein
MAVREQVQVGVDLSPIADDEGTEVPEALGRAPEEEADDPQVDADQLEDVREHPGDDDRRHAKDGRKPVIHRFWRAGGSISTSTG